MKILINYDFFNEVKNARQPITPLKIIRNHKVPIATIHFPLCMAINMRTHDLIGSLGVYAFDLLFMSGLYLMMDSLFTRNFGKDPYAEVAKDRLFSLAAKMRSFDFNTDYDLLLKSQAYKTERRFELNENRIPFISETKFILVPNYINGDVTKTSIKQEHIVGTNEYVLSLGSPIKKLKMAKSRLAYS